VLSPRSVIASRKEFALDQTTQTPGQQAPIGRRKVVAAGGVAALVVGGAMAAAAAGVVPVVSAADPTASGSTVPSGSQAPAASTTPDNESTETHDGGLGANHETVSDASVAAQALGMTEADLQTALSSGQSLAQIAQSKGVAVQTVIDALVADQNSEIDAALKAGQITQAQADAEKAEVSQRVTDRVNGTFQGGRGHVKDQAAPSASSGTTG
jgi:hypothetical protein